MASHKHMTFHRFGRSYHLKIETAEDLKTAVDMEQAHWVATGSPINVISCDETLLEWADNDTQVCESLRI